MKIEEFIKTSQNGGEKIVTICGHYFQPHFWKCYSYPLYVKIPVNHNLVRSLRWKYLITTVFTETIIKNTYEFVLSTNNYDINNFQTKKRNEIRQSLNNFTFKKPAFEDMLITGREINKQAIKKQKRKDNKLTNVYNWRKYLSSIYSNDSVIIHGAYAGDRLVGYLIVFEIDQKYNIHYAFIDRYATGNKSPMNGMLYALINKLIKENGTVNISYGVFSFIPKPELYKYKLDMQFKMIPASRVYIINPVLLFFFDIIIFFSIKLLKKKNIRNKLVRKIISLYQGNRILNRQLKIA